MGVERCEEFQGSSQAYRFIRTNLPAVRKNWIELSRIKITFTCRLAGGGTLQENSGLKLEIEKIMAWNLIIFL